MLILLTTAVAVILAQEKKPGAATDEIVMLGGLKIKEGADVKAAEKLFNEHLIPAMNGIDGLEMKILKRMKMPNEQPDPNAYDYIMMAQVQKPEILMQLMQARNPKLDEFGDLMKQYAEEPSFKMYTVITKTSKKE